MPRLPDANPRLGLSVELVTGFDVERAIPCVQIPGRGASIFAGRVAVGHDLLAKRRVGTHRPPPLGERQKKAVLAGQAVFDGVGSSVQRQEIGVVRDLQSR
jgi:hypothetical protein